MLRILLPSTLLIVGCTAQPIIETPYAAHIGKATMKVNADNSTDVTLSMNGKEYSGKLYDSKVDESAQIAERYGVNSSQYKNYARGTANYLRRGTVNLKSSQGESMECEISYRGLFGKATCSTEGKKFEILLEKDHPEKPEESNH